MNEDGDDVIKDRYIIYNFVIYGVGCLLKIQYHVQQTNLSDYFYSLFLRLEWNSDKTFWACFFIFHRLR